MNRQQWEERYVEMKKNGQVGSMRWDGDDPADLDKMLALIGFKTGGIFLNYGCGLDHHWEMLVAKFKPETYFGYDFSETAVKEAAERHPGWQRSFDLIPAHCDTFFLSYVLASMDYDGAMDVFETAHGTLNRGGQLIIIEDISGTNDKLYYRTVKELKSMLCTGGWDETEIKTADMKIIARCVK